MAAVDSELESALGQAYSGLVVRATQHRGCTHLDVATEDGIHTVTLAALPDERLAAATRRGMRRVSSVRFDVDGRGARCTLRGTTHRTPRTVEVPIGVGLGLLGQGIVGLVVHREVG